MANPLTLPTLAILAIAGIGGGMALGNSAVAEIDPVHYGSADAGDPFHADLVANRPSFDAPAQYQNAAMTTGLGSGCINCRTYPEEYVPTRDPAFEAYVASYDTPAAVEADALLNQIDRELEASAFRAAQKQIERYTQFAVAAEEASAPVVRVAAEAPPASDCAAADSCAAAETPEI